MPGPNLSFDETGGVRLGGSDNTCGRRKYGEGLARRYNDRISLRMCGSAFGVVTEILAENHPEIRQSPNCGTTRLLYVQAIAVEGSCHADELIAPICGPAVERRRI